MRRHMLGVAAMCVVAAGCVSVSPPPPSTTSAFPPGAQVTPSWIPSLPPGLIATPVPTPPQISTLPTLVTPVPVVTQGPIDAPTPSPAHATLTVTFDSGPNKGTYNVSGDPQCSYGLIDADTWAAQYGDLSAADGQLSTVQLQVAPDTSGKSGKDFITSVFIVVGPIFGGTNYTVSLDRFSNGPSTTEIVDHGSTATIHVVGKSTASPLGPGGVLVDLALSCPTVSRA